MTANHYALLMLEYGAAFIELEKVAGKYLSLSPAEADKKAASMRLPFPTVRFGTQKSPWMVSVLELAKYLDGKHKESADLWNKMNAA